VISSLDLKHNFIDGEINDPDFGRGVSAAVPRLAQVAAKFHF